MARVARSEHFNGTDDTPLSVSAGTFDASGVDRQRTGSSNARSVTNKAGIFGFRAGSQQQRVNLVTIAVLLTTVMLLLPMVISAVGSARREAILAAERESEDRPVMVVIDPAVDEAKNSVNQALGAYAISSAYVPQDKADKMRELLEQVSASVHENDEGKTRGFADEAREYFVSSYAPALAKRGIELADEWGSMNWETYTGIEDAVESLQGALPGKNADAIAKHVIDLASLLGQGRDEHYQNRVTYVPPPPPPEPKPKKTEEPKKTEAPKKTEEPKQTQQPKPAEPKPEETKPADPKPADPPSNGGTAPAVNNG